MKFFILLSLTALMSCSHQNAQKESTPVTSVSQKLETPKTIAEAVTSPLRSDDFKARDIYRHPEETLTFFGIKPHMKVLEITPGAGWYTEILAPLLNDKGQYIMAVSPANSPAPKSERIAEWSKKYPTIGSNIKSTIFDPSDASAKLGEDNSIDMVLTFRNVHNWMAGQTEDNAFKMFFNVLKKGGTLGVVDHRALKNSKEVLAKSGYVREKDILRMAKKAGFKYVGKSEINANAKDTKNHPNGVWSLPPTLSLKEVDREKYLAIGESDRMTMRFIKP
jgi:predicted methyltransferase